MKRLGMLIGLICPMLVFSQTNYYWKYGKKSSLKEDASSEIVFQKGEKSLAVSSSLRVKNVEDNFDKKNGYYKVIEYNSCQQKSAFDTSIVKNSSWRLIDSENNKMWLSHFVRVKFKNNFNTDSIVDILKKYNATFTDNEFGICNYQVPNLEDVLKVANEIYEKGVAFWSQPDFIVRMNLCSDPWEGQYYLHNTDHSYGGFNHDINAFEAWVLTKGSSSITVGVIDDGVEDHTDLYDESGNSRVLKGYTPSGLTLNGRPTSSDEHGEACAGIIAASHSKNIRGIAPNVKILPVKVRFSSAGTVSEFSDAIRWAYRNGADILSNSWGGGDYQDIVDAIVDAENFGRGGKGSVVVFSTGNDGATTISAYASNSIAVGAIDKYDTPAKYLTTQYTNVGIGQDLVAYGGTVDNSGYSDIRTIDRIGARGYTGADYYDHFGGTSAACPQVSGVAALVLSINPDLTREEVETILFNTATDLGSEGRDQIYGYGKVNAFAAVLAAYESLGKKLDIKEGVLSYNKIKSNVLVNFTGMPASAVYKGNYCCDVYKAETTIDADSYFWYLGDGLSGATTNTGNYYVNINNDKKTAFTFFYYIKTDELGNVINKWVPQNPSSSKARKYWSASTNTSKNLNLESDSTKECKVSIYPNPNNGNFTLNTSGNIDKNATIQIYNLTGQLLYKADIYEPNQNIVFSHTAGMYLLKVSNGNTIYSQKLIVE